MIIEMFKDIRIFLLIFFTGILAFSNIFYVLDLGNTTKITGFDDDSYFVSILYVYLQSLGELGIDGYQGNHLELMYWSLFFFSTIFLQITLLNLLIAIMGDTFDRVMEVAKEA
jgi:hypothetical protein